MKRCEISYTCPATSDVLGEGSNLLRKWSFKIMNFQELWMKLIDGSSRFSGSRGGDYNSHKSMAQAEQVYQNAPTQIEEFHNENWGDNRTVSSTETRTQTEVRS